MDGTAGEKTAFEDILNGGVSIKNRYLFFCVLVSGNRKASSAVASAGLNGKILCCKEPGRHIVIIIDQRAGGEENI